MSIFDTAESENTNDTPTKIMGSKSSDLVSSDSNVGSLSVDGTPVEEDKQTEDPTNTDTDSAPAVEVTSPEPAPVTEDAFLEAFLDRLEPVNKIKKNLKVLIYSLPGCGKSVLSGTAPNNLIVDVEDGLISLRNHPDIVKLDSIRTYPYKSFVGLEMAIDRLNKRVPQLDWCETVTVDTVSELHKRGLAEVTEREFGKDVMRNRYVAETEDHTENNEHIRRLVSSLRDLDRNVILLAHSRTIEPKGQLPRTFPDFSEKLANTLAGIVDIVGYMYLKEHEGKVHRVLQLHGDGQVVAKTRIGGYPRALVDPTWETLYDTFIEAQKKNLGEQSMSI